MRTVSVRCDQCARDLTETRNCEDYRLAVVNERIRSVGGVVTAMAAYPCLDRDYHFCSLNCLCDWAVAKHAPQNPLANSHASE